MKGFAKFYFWYLSLPGIFIRLLLFITFALGAAALLIHQVVPNIFLMLLGFLMMFEIFFRYKVAKASPKVEVLNNSADPQDSFSLELLGIV